MARVASITMADAVPVRLTANTRFSGCGAKLGPGLLDRALCGLTQPDFPDLLVGYSTSDDAGIYRISDDVALVQTVDFFPPIVDDPVAFGRIAACNALSDVYAMGGTPLTALAIVCFPQASMDIAVLRGMMRGALEILAEAQTALVGGHSIEDDTVKFGLAVTGRIHPRAALRNNTPRPGDTLILTKPLGTGIINAALRGELADPAALDAALRSMTTLNRDAARVALAHGASACTDVTGFGLLGHAAEMVVNTGAGLTISFATLPLLPLVVEYARTGLIPAGAYRNREFRSAMVRGL
ncbi:MAG TPA: selenide, water dikinase SelD, partial [bacterium]|nr:selenide, water dikinase SelD [bacterium]